jgi:hypothetical protein
LIPHDFFSPCPKITLNSHPKALNETLVRTTNTFVRKGNEKPSLYFVLLIVLLIVGRNPHWMKNVSRKSAMCGEIESGDYYQCFCKNFIFVFILGG